MKHIFYSLVVAIWLPHLDGRRFRCDYNYLKNIRGFIKYQEIPSTWDEAQLRCNLEGALLMSPIMPGFKKAMTSLANQSSVCGIHTGLHSRFSKGDFISIEGVKLSAISHTWAKEEPNNNNDEESCIAMLLDGTIADISCNETLPYICYRKYDKNMKMYRCGHDKDYGYCRKANKCYKFHNTPQVWSRAYKTCDAESGHLAIINNISEIDIFKQMFVKMHARRAIQDVAASAFLGFRDWNGEWRTIHGQTLEESGYHKFKAGSINKTLNFNVCGGIDNNANLVPLQCDIESVFICEKDMEPRVCPKRV
ncbi:macrophage mannose receptor 1-like [Pectinophora gossypiella]|uniref:macrophage mannose receptor 1-like n=1 Tax=Pectinophora gossypiella TaxID=13191 RepID=UPI00214F22CE|nr:macrophage mannose receptor 1-like [Pectinophora gossypiella]